MINSLAGISFSLSFNSITPYQFFNQMHLCVPLKTVLSDQINLTNFDAIALAISGGKVNYAAETPHDTEQMSGW